MSSLLNDVRRKNGTLQVEYIKKHPQDMVATWCIAQNEAMQEHCEILRTTQSFDGALSMHYLNKNPKHFETIKQEWLERILKARVYQSYFRLDRILNKSMTFEL